MLTLWNPFMPVKKSEYRSMFDLLFDDIFQPMGINQTKSDDGSFYIDVDLPGMQESDINVHLSEDNILTIKGDRKTKTSSYSVNKSFTLPDGCDPDTLKAELKNGVLSISLAPKQLPKVKEPKKIPISAK